MRNYKITTTVADKIEHTITKFFLWRLSLFLFIVKECILKYCKGFWKKCVGISRNLATFLNRCHFCAGQNWT